MTKEDKELVFKDLSARLPHHVRVKVWLKDGTTEEGILDLEHNYGDVLRDAFYYNKIVDIKPYLRPMSSMTEEEEKIRIIYERDIMSQGFGVVRIYMNSYIEWLDSKQFDWRTDGNGKTMIERGLALEAQDGMYNIKEK